MVYAYNPGKVPQHWGPIVVQPLNFQPVTEEQAAQMRESKIPVLLEGDEGFPNLWQRHIPPGFPPFDPE